MTLRHGFTILTVTLALWVGVGAAPPPARDRQGLFQFGVEMARKGNWREAKYRWEKALELAPADRKILNNLGVACEALGEPDAALQRYKAALDVSPSDAVALENENRLERFRARTAKEAGGEAAAKGLPAAGSATEPAKKGKTATVVIHLPVPPRLDLTKVKRVLVASFVTADSDLVDTNREVVRFLRSEVRKRTSLEVLEITPPPAVPEQTIDELAANTGFFLHLGAETGADLIVTGSVQFSKRDTSGFQEVDIVSPVTGQKIRETRFVEQEQFQFDMAVLFFDGSTGTLLLRDRLRRNVQYNGLSNDPVTAFFDVADATSGDFLASVAPGSREEPRLLYKK